MRLFTAIPLPSEIEQRLLKMEDENVSGIKWQSQNNLHLTLVFIGDVDEEKGDRIKYQLQKILIPSFSITVRSVGSFPPKRKPRVVWVGIEQCDPLIRLQQSIKEIVESCDVKPDDRSYVPHITLGKVKDADYAIVERYLAKYRDVFVGTVDINQFGLFESKLSSSGAVHTCIASYPANNML